MTEVNFVSFFQKCLKIIALERTRTSLCCVYNVHTPVPPAQVSLAIPSTMLCDEVLVNLSLDL